MNPTWYNNIPTPYNPTYPNWDSLPVLTFSETVAKLKSFGLPELYADRPTKPSFFKIPPWDTFRSFNCYAGAWSKSWSMAETACLSLGFLNAATTYMWCANTSIFQLSSRVHRFNMSLLMKPNKQIGAFWWDGTVYDGGSEFTNAEELAKLNERYRVTSVGLI